MASYWQRRRERADARLARAERDVAKRAARYYRDELKRLEEALAAFYAEVPPDEVSAYRAALAAMDPDAERLLWEDCDEFARAHPERAWMVPVRKRLYRLTRLEGLQASARLGLARATARVDEGLPGHFESVAGESARAVSDALGHDVYDDATVRAFVGAPWSDGRNYSDAIWQNADRLAEHVSGDLARGLARGDSYQRLCAEMSRRFAGQAVSDCMRVVQTEGTYVSRKVQGDAMRRAGFERYYVDARGDERTCDTCRAVSAQSHRAPLSFDDARPGENYPPLHPRCRCDVNPAVDDWAEWLRAHGDAGKAAAERFGADVERGISSKKSPKVDAAVDLDTIRSRDYARSFDGITGNPKADRTLLKCARACLTHRAGTAFEDLHLVSIIDGRVKASQTSSATPLQVDNSSAIAKAVHDEPEGSLFAIHNHPTNVPPSGSDLCASGARGYAGGLVVLHNGAVYYYRHGDAPFSSRQFDYMVQSKIGRGMIEQRAYEETLGYFEQRYGIQWRRIR